MPHGLMEISWWEWGWWHKSEQPCCRQMCVNLGGGERKWDLPGSKTRLSQHRCWELNVIAWIFQRHLQGCFVTPGQCIWQFLSVMVPSFLTALTATRSLGNPPKVMNVGGIWLHSRTPPWVLASHNLGKIT